MKINKKTIAAFKLSNLVACIILSTYVQAEVVQVYTATELQNALKTASAGDEIVVNAGSYVGNKATSGSSKAHFYSDRSGEANDPIILRSADIINKQVLKGSTIDSGYIFYLNGDNWVIKDLKFSTAQKGIMLEGSNHNEIDNVELSNLGAEAVHMRYFSSDNVLSNCYIHDTGKRVGQEGFGEGVYIGTHDGHTAEKLDHSDNNRIGGCVIGPNVTAEAFDIKAGVSGTVIEFNSINSSGIIGDAGNPAADSFIDLKGTNNVIRNNHFDWGGDSNIAHAVFTYQEHRSSNIYNNEINLGVDTPTYKILEETIHAQNNTRLDGGTKLVDASYQANKIDSVLDPSIEKPSRSYTCFDELNGCGMPITPPNPSSMYPIVTASSNDGNVPENTLDGDLSESSRWSAYGIGEWIKFELEQTENVAVLKIAFNMGDTRQSNIQIQRSFDGNSWDNLLTATSSGETLGFESFNLNGAQGRYFRVIGNGNSVNDWNSFTEVAFEFGQGTPPSSEITGCDGVADINWGDKTEVSIATTDCIRFDNDLTNGVLQAWDSDANDSCDFRGEITATSNSSITATVNSNYHAINSLSGKTFKLSPNNNCQYIKLRAY